MALNQEFDHSKIDHSPNQLDLEDFIKSLDRKERVKNKRRRINRKDRH